MNWPIARISHLCRWANNPTPTSREVYCCTQIHRKLRRLLRNPMEPAQREG